ncbi:hypothetical protein [Leucobacter sp. OH1287]|nr:hypothetical protein [Leucobacter sp. OH1287]
MFQYPNPVYPNSRNSGKHPCKPATPRHRSQQTDAVSGSTTQKAGA